MHETFDEYLRRKEAELREIVDSIKATPDELDELRALADNNCHSVQVDRLYDHEKREFLDLIAAQDLTWVGQQIAAGALLRIFD